MNWFHSLVSCAFGPKVKLLGDEPETVPQFCWGALDAGVNLFVGDVALLVLQNKTKGTRPKQFLNWRA